MEPQTDARINLFIIFFPFVSFVELSLTLESWQLFAFHFRLVFTSIWSLVKLYQACKRKTKKVYGYGYGLLYNSAQDIRRDSRRKTRREFRFEAWMADDPSALGECNKKLSSLKKKGKKNTDESLFFLSMFATTRFKHSCRGKLDISLLRCSILRISTKSR